MDKGKPGSEALSNLKTTDALNLLASDLNCDKRRGHHGYVKYYEELFESMRSSKVNMLEIGIAKGRSQAMWSLYFPKGTINCIDIGDSAGYFECRDQEVGDRAISRIKPVIMDQSDKPALDAFSAECGPFDIVIDDGSHKPDHQIASFETLIGNTTKYYIIEDMHPYYEEGHRGHKTIRYFQSVINEINRYGDINRLADIDFYPKDERIESVTFVPNAIIVRVRQ